MNAYELAEIMEIHDGSQIWEHGLEIANMLRQQANELEAFKLNFYNTGYTLQLRDKDETIRQQADRIAELEKELLKNFEKGAAFGFDEGIIHQKQQTKPLSDEEIIELFENPDDFSCIEFARAIEERHGIK